LTCLRGLHHLLTVKVEASPGQVAVVEFNELPGKKFPAKVARAAGLIDAASGTMRVELTLPNPERQIPAGLNGVALITPAAEGVARPLRVPVNAIVVRDGRQHVAIGREGKVAFVPVRTGRNTGARIEVIEGLAADASVIVNPNGLLQEGQAIPASPSP
jgi:multidrug efflux pump subunit AcrA (membrane-fusion protein)